jgi:predicted 3-demethylubiquinone-9 3-methyltransferase (glyoxalase superfamily)
MTTATTNPVSETADREISTTRIFDAPRNLVWQVWTDPQHLEEWGAEWIYNDHQRVRLSSGRQVAFYDARLLTNLTIQRRNVMQKITPFLWFDNQAEEAANFYISVFKDSKVGKVSRYGDAGPGPKGSVMVAEFELNGQRFIALNGGPQFKFTEAVSFVINCETQDEVDYYWSKLTADGGEESMCGWLKDKFGLSWQVTPTIMGKLFSADPTGAQRAMQAMLQMKKLDIQKLQDAYDGK